MSSSGKVIVVGAGMVGLATACPDGEGFKAKFEGFQVKHLPDQRRLEWLKAHADN